MATGDDETRRTPALVFCFNRDECWSVAEQLKGKSLLSDGQQKRLVDHLSHHDWSKGAGPKLEADPAARRGHPSRGNSAEISPTGRRPLSAQTSDRLRLHGDIGCGHQSCPLDRSS